MVKLLKYRVRCTTDSTFEFWTLNTSDPVPTTCPVNTAHSIDSNQTSIVETFETNGNSGTTSTMNSNSSLSETSYNFRSDLAQSATLTTIVLDASASAIDDIYNNLVIEITNGLAQNQARLITDYDGTTKTATISPDWSITPNSTSTFTIHRNSGLIPKQSQDQTNLGRTIKLNASASSIDDIFNDCFISILGGNGVGQLRRIVNYDGTTKVVTIDRRLEDPVSNNTIYAIYGEGGTAASATSTTIVRW